ncbi:LOB domain-containing protein 29 [Zea mays]|uniref:LOB domain-containing protein 29 n=1 Tax=Zea mays TaxID=4577 RepID=A0A317Y2S6_MAIZE|nr:LOB domain-containing protein 29 [Zea mays]
MTGLGSPCGACKFLRRKCVKGCVFAPYFCHEQGAAHFAAIHKVFGASNASKLLMHLPISDRCEAAVTMSYEAQARLQDPIYGCVAHIFSLQQQVVRLQAELESFKALAIQGCGDGSLTSNPQKENCERLAPYIQDGQLFYQPTMANNSSVKSERQLYFANDCFTSTSTQHSEGYEPDICMPDYYNNSNPSWTTQGSGYHDIDELQSVAFAYLDNA